MWCGLGTAAAVAGLAMALTVTPVSAKAKTCWAHYDEVDGYVAVWANGNGHFNNHDNEPPHDSNMDIELGGEDHTVDSRAECETLFADEGP